MGDKKSIKVRDPGYFRTRNLQVHLGLLLLGEIANDRDQIFYSLFWAKLICEKSSAAYADVVAKSGVVEQRPDRIG